MSLKKLYEKKDVNWVLVPGLLEEVAAEILLETHEEKRSLLTAKSSYSIDTVSLQADFAQGVEFLTILKTLNDSVVQIRASLTVHPDGYEIPGPDCEMVSSSAGVEIKFTRPNVMASLKLSERFEEVLQLTAYRPVLNEEHVVLRRRTAFIAHAFNPNGQSYAFQLTKFLSLLGFEVATGEGFSPEKVSSKVKRRLLAQEIVIVIVSENEDFTWLIQEAAGADFLKKPIILLVQEEVEFKPGVLSDLEYIRFRRGHIEETFLPILEGLREIGFSFS